MANVQTNKKPSLFIATLPIVITLLLMCCQIFYFGDFTPHIPLLIGIFITGLTGKYLGINWPKLESSIFEVVKAGLPSVGILILVGMIIAVWIACGTVPLLIYYGLQLLSPELFLAASMLLCTIVSVSLGTSWGTTGTIGLALVGIGSGFDIPVYWTAGAIVSGAFFGDKISPLSDTTNLAPAVAQVSLFDHIKNLIPTTLPAMLIALTIYIVVGFNYIGDHEADFNKIITITETLDHHFNLSPLLLAPPVIVLTLALLKVPSLPAISAGVITGGFLAFTEQELAVQVIFGYLQNGFSIQTQVEAVDQLLNRGGILSMAWVITLILIALSFGAALEKVGCLEIILNCFIKRIKRFGSLQATTIGASITTNLVGGDPYLSIALPGRMFAPAYHQLGYSKLNLSRAVEEGGTLISPLIPWNAGGAVVITALGLGITAGHVENLLYIPLSFACWLSPVIGIFYAYFGFFSPKITNESNKKEQLNKTKPVALSTT